MKLKYYILVDGRGCRDRYFETKRCGGNDERNKINKTGLRRFYDSSQVLRFIASILARSKGNQTRKQISRKKEDGLTDLQLAYLYYITSVHTLTRMQMIASSTVQ